MLVIRPGSFPPGINAYHRWDRIRPAVAGMFPNSGKTNTSYHKFTMIGDLELGESCERTMIFMIRWGLGPHFFLYIGAWWCRFGVGTRILRRYFEWGHVLHGVAFQGGFRDNEINGEGLYIWVCLALLRLAALICSQRLLEWSLVKNIQPSLCGDPFGFVQE